MCSRSPSEPWVRATKRKPQFFWVPQKRHTHLSGDSETPSLQRNTFNWPKLIGGTGTLPALVNCALCLARTKPKTGRGLAESFVSAGFWEGGNCLRTPALKRSDQAKEDFSFSESKFAAHSTFFWRGSQPPRRCLSLFVARKLLVAYCRKGNARRSQAHVDGAEARGGRAVAASRWVARRFYLSLFLFLFFFLELVTSKEGLLEGTPEGRQPSLVVFFPPIFRLTRLLPRR